nr:hypothetical protein [Salegentibacter tibetensis]
MITPGNISARYGRTILFYNLLQKRDIQTSTCSCKSAYHYQALQEEGSGFYVRVDRHLKTNRRILKRFNKAGKATVKSEVLIEQGFNPKFFTHYWKNAQGDVYLFVYEYGFLSRKENGMKKFVLVTWQSYMENGQIS